VSRSDEILRGMLVSNASYVCMFIMGRHFSSTGMALTKTMQRFGFGELLFFSLFSFSNLKTKRLQRNFKYHFGLSLLTHTSWEVPASVPHHT